tara:strand:+ start:56 stop:1270 length:1215 start_codon:yes stop_codon:yes gene_type:complete
MNYICYIFGYGSLVNVKNRNKTCSTQGFPAIINKDFKYVRTASYPAMGIKKIKKEDSKKPINGVLLEVTPEQLKKFDKREKHYYRIKVPHEYITSLSKIQIDKTLPVYIYKPKSSFGKKTRKKPSKKYLNIVIDGFKKYGKKFSDMFLSTTIDLPKKINKFTRKMRGGMEDQVNRMNPERVPSLLSKALIEKEGGLKEGELFRMNEEDGNFRVLYFSRGGDDVYIEAEKTDADYMRFRRILFNLADNKYNYQSRARRITQGGSKKRTRKNQKGGDEQPSLQHVLMLISTGRIFTEYPDENDRNYLINNVVNRWKEVILESSQNDTVMDRHIKNVKRAILGYTIHILEPPDNAVLMNLNSLEEILMDENTPYRNLPEDEGVHKVKKINMFRNIINMINSLTDRTN